MSLKHKNGRESLQVEQLRGALGIEGLSLVLVRLYLKQLEVWPLVWALRPFRGIVGTRRVHVGYIVGIF